MMLRKWKEHFVNVASNGRGWPMRSDTPETSQAADITPQLLTTAEAAKLAGVGERTWWRWTRCGLAPRPISIGLGTRPAVRYRRSDLLQWIDAGCPRVDNGKGGGR